MPREDGGGELERGLGVAGGLGLEWAEWGLIGCLPGPQLGSPVADDIVNLDCVARVEAFDPQFQVWEAGKTLLSDLRKAGSDDAHRRDERHDKASNGWHDCYVCAIRIQSKT